MQASSLNNAGRQRAAAPPAADGFFSAGWRNTMEFIGDWASEVFLEEHRIDDEESSLSAELDDEEQRTLMDGDEYDSASESTLVDLRESVADEDFAGSVRQAREKLDARGRALGETATTVDRLQRVANETRQRAAEVRERKAQQKQSRFCCC